MLNRREHRELLFSLVHYENEYLRKKLILKQHLVILMESNEKAFNFPKSSITKKTKEHV